MTAFKKINFVHIQLIDLLSIIAFLVIVLYLYPDTFFLLYNTILGNFLLVMLVAFVGSKNYMFAIGLGAILFVIYKLNPSLREGFTWTSDSTKNFIDVQKTINPHVVFDTDELQKQAPQEELDFFLQNGRWSWSQQVQELYKRSVAANPFVRTDPEDAMNAAMKIYNQSIILEMISWQTKEGQFLLKGVAVGSGNELEDLPSGWGDYGYSSGLIEKRNNVIMCGVDKGGKSSLHQTKFTGKDKITGAQTKEVTAVDYNILEDLIPGFSFINGKCNPCVAINDTPDYSCPFSLDISGNRQGVSAVWQYLWGYQSKPSSVNNESDPNPNNFPLLSGLKNELDALFPTNNTK
jgi:hypothetical protein